MMKADKVVSTSRLGVGGAHTKIAGGNVNSDKTLAGRRSAQIIHGGVTLHVVEKPADSGIYETSFGAQYQL